MTLQSSGQITLTNIQNEFGGTNPISFSEYLGNGYYVPIGDNGIPSSGPLSISRFYGASDYHFLSDSLSNIGVEHADQGWWNTGTYVGSADGYPMYTIDWNNSPNSPGTPYSRVMPFRVGMLEIYQSAWLDYGYRIFINVNGTGWNYICGIYDGASGANNIGGTSYVTYNIANGANVQFAFAAGPEWKDQIHEGVFNITYHKVRDPAYVTDAYSLTSGQETFWQRGHLYNDYYSSVWMNVYINGVLTVSDPSGFDLTSYTVGSNTYYRGTLQSVFDQFLFDYDAFLYYEYYAVSGYSPYY